MKLERRHWIAIGIGMIFIISGLLQGIFDLDVSKGPIKDISFILLMAAAFLLYSGRKKKSNEDTADKHESGAVKDETKTDGEKDRQIKL